MLFMLFLYYMYNTTQKAQHYVKGDWSFNLAYEVSIIIKNSFR